MICPPSNAISIRTRSALLTRYDLRENSVHGVGMDESNLEPEQTLARSFVDQVRSRAGELGERRRQVAHVESDVVHARAALREEPADGSVGAEGLEQLDATVADAQRHRTDTLLLDRRAVLDLGAEKPRSEERRV